MLITDPTQARGFTKEAPGAFLQRQAGKVWKEHAIIEIGVYFGRSLLYLARGAAEGLGAHVYGFDPYDLPGIRYPFAWTEEKAHRSLFTLAATREEAERNVTQNPWAAHVTLTRAFSEEAAESWDGLPIALAHIDGHHGYEHVRGDFEAWSKHFTSHAVLAFDDYTKNCPEVVKAVNDLYAEGRITEPKLAKGCRRLAVARFVK
jgi:hypothetical protein